MRSRQDTGATAIDASKDHARFRSVVMPHLDAAYNLARWLTRNDADAEDIVQEACLRAFRAIRTFADGSARAWFLIIVRHTTYSWLGKNRSAALVITDDLEAFEHAGAVSSDSEVKTPESELIAAADASRLRAAIRHLPPPFRETLILRDLQELDYKEIATITEAPIGTVMSRLARARQRLVAEIAAV
jgi:RNA polymerase sigma factor (sigma-70 family)